MMAGFLSRLLGITQEAKLPEQGPVNDSGKDCFERGECSSCTSSAPERCPIAKGHTCGSHWRPPVGHDWTGNIQNAKFVG